MRILIYGAGAVGSFIGGHLALAGHHVTLLGRDWLKNAINTAGLKLEAADGTQKIVHNIAVATNLTDAFANSSPYDWIAFTMKAFDTVPAIFELKKVISAPPTVASFQNGIGNEESLRSAFGLDNIVAGTLTTPVSMPAPGYVIEEKARGIAIACGLPAAEPVKVALQATALTLTMLDRADALKWSKLLLNMVGNATAAILDLTPDQVFADPQMFRIEYAALREALQVMKLKDIPTVNLPGADAKSLALAVRYLPPVILRPLLRRQVEIGRGNKLPSLLQALRAEEALTEVTWLNGAVVQAADSLNRLAPVNHALALTVADIAARRVSWDMYRNRPDMLISTIHAAQGME